MANDKRVNLSPGKKAAAPAAIGKKRKRRAVSHTSAATSLTAFREGMQRATRHIFLVLVVLLGISIVLGFGLVPLPNMRSESGQATDQVAKFGGHVIARDEFEKMVDQATQRSSMFMPSGPTADLDIRNMILDQDVDHQLRLDAAKAEGNRVGRKQLQDRITEAIDQQIQQQRSDLMRTKDKDAEKKFLAKMEVKTWDQLRKKMEGQIDPNWLASTKDQLLLSNLEKTVKKRAAKMSIANVKPEDLEYHVRLIEAAITPPPPKGSKPGPNTPAPQTKEQAKAKADAIYNEIKAGADFGKVASEKSDDAYTKSKQGDMGWVGYNGFYPSETRDAALKLKDGEASAPIETRSGYYIVKMEGRRYSEEKYWNDYLDNLKKKANVTVIDPVLKAYRQMQEDTSAASKALAAVKPGDKAGLQKAQENQKKVRENSIASLQKAVDQVYDPHTKSAVYYEIGQLYSQDANRAKAIEFYGKAAEAMPSPEVFAEMGDAQRLLYDDQGRKDEKLKDAAIESYKKAADMAGDPTSSSNLSIHQRLQNAYTEMGAKELADAEGKWVEKNRAAAQSSMFGGLGGGTFNVP